MLYPENCTICLEVILLLVRLPLQRCWEHLCLWSRKNSKFYYNKYCRARCRSYRLPDIRYCVVQNQWDIYVDQPKSD